MNTVVRRFYPAQKLPAELREGIDPSKNVTVTVVEEEVPEPAMSFEEIFATRTPPYLTKDEIDERLRELRRDRDDG